MFRSFWLFIWCLRGNDVVVGLVSGSYFFLGFGFWVVVVGVLVYVVVIGL